MGAGAAQAASSNSRKNSLMAAQLPARVDRQQAVEVGDLFEYLAAARACASPRIGATICRPTGRPYWSKPQGTHTAGQLVSVMAR